MRVCVFVDGENLRWTISDLFTDQQFDRRDYLPKNADWEVFFDELVADATGGRADRLRTYWYVIGAVDPFPQTVARSKRTPDSLEAWVRHNRKFLRDDYDLSGLGPEDRATRVAQMQDELHRERQRIRNRFDGFTKIQNGIAQNHRSIEFRRSGAIGYNLFTRRLGQEKTVDVNLAVDLFRLQSNYDVALIVSGDQDYVPAVQAAKDLGKQVINVAFLARNGRLLPGGARRLNEITDWSLKVEYDRFRNILKLPEPKEEQGPQTGGSDNKLADASDP